MSIGVTGGILLVVGVFLVLINLALLWLTYVTAESPAHRPAVLNRTDAD